MNTWFLVFSRNKGLAEALHLKLDGGHSSAAHPPCPWGSAQRGFRQLYQKVAKAHNPAMGAEVVRELPSCLPTAVTTVTNTPVTCRSVPQAFESKSRSLVPQLDCPNGKFQRDSPIWSPWEEGGGAGVAVVVAVEMPHGRTRAAASGKWPPGFCTTKATRSGYLRNVLPFVFSLRARFPFQLEWSQKESGYSSSITASPQAHSLRIYFVISVYFKFAAQQLSREPQALLGGRCLVWSGQCLTVGTPGMLPAFPLLSRWAGMSPHVGFHGGETWVGFAA